MEEYSDAAMATFALLAPSDSVLGSDPPERNDGHSERSSGRDVEVVPMNKRMVAACTENGYAW